MNNSITTLGTVVRVLDGFYPPAQAQSWDAVGLVSGDLEQPVERVMFAVDPTMEVIADAVDAGVDLLVTHHPLLLRGVKSVATTSGKGNAITSLIVNDVALYCAHTNADVARPGVNDALAAAAGLSGELEPLVMTEGQGLGLVGDLSKALTLGEFAQRFAAQLPAAPVGIRVSGDVDAQVRRVAVLGGAGDSAFAEARESGADVYITADLRHHPALEAREEVRMRGGEPHPLFLIDAGHWATESLWLQAAAERLREAIAADGGDIDVTVSTRRTDPWDLVYSTGRSTQGEAQ